MINGFEKETCPLSYIEKNTLMPIVVSILSSKKGIETSITNPEICAFIRDVHSIEITPARVRKLVNYIRCFDLVKNLVATSKGYYIASTKDELQRYIESLQGRECAIRSVRESLQHQMQELEV